MEKSVHRLILKPNDILIINVPRTYFDNGNALLSIYRQIREKLRDSGKKNKVLIVPNEVNFKVIGEEEIKEHISNVDLWHLFEDDEET
jgi:hypothetical protein